MQIVDWLLVFGLNGAIVAYGVYLSRSTKSSADWFLGGRGFPWWIVGLSCYATAIDSSDLVADSGGVYDLGIRYFVTNWVGVVVGWWLATRFVALGMYRAGMYTNAEYLEARFGPMTRAVSALVQVLYRTIVMGIMATTMFLSLTIIGGLSDGVAWFIVALVAAATTVYTSLGGLKSSAITESLQSAVMVAATLTLFVAVWMRVGGWQGLEEKLTAVDPDLAASMLHVGEDHIHRQSVDGVEALEIEHRVRLGASIDAVSNEIVTVTPAWLLCLEFILVGVAYSIVNHEQAMRLFGARSEWDMKMSLGVSGALMLVMAFCNLIMGVIGRAIYPTAASMTSLSADLQRPDSIYPLLVSDVDWIGFKGLIVAGLLAASFSTFDAISSALSSLVTRDVYARVFVRNASDNHYVWVGRIVTVAVVALSFLYVPFLLRRGMLMFYLDMVGAFVAPLLTVYLMGTFTRVHRRSGAIGLLVGVAYGVGRLVASAIEKNYASLPLPPAVLDVHLSYVWSVLLTAGAMTVVSLVCGWEPAGKPMLRPETEGWLGRSSEEVRRIDAAHDTHRSNLLPNIVAAIVLAACCYTAFVLFW